MPSLSTTFTAFADVTRTNSVAGWQNVGNAQASDDVRATTQTVGSSGYTDFLQATGLAGKIPSNAVVTGIVVSIERSDPQGITTDSYVRLVVGGAIVGNDKASSSSWPTTDATATYGGSADLWGLSLTATQVNASNFGVALSAGVGFGGASTNPGTGGSNLS